MLRNLFALLLLVMLNFYECSNSTCSEADFRLVDSNILIELYEVIEIELQLFPIIQNVTSFECVLEEELYLAPAEHKLNISDLIPTQRVQNHGSISIFASISPSKFKNLNKQACLNYYSQFHTIWICILNLVNDKGRKIQTFLVQLLNEKDRNNTYATGELLHFNKSSQSTNSKLVVEPTKYESYIDTSICKYNDCQITKPFFQLKDYGSISFRVDFNSYFTRQMSVNVFRFEMKIYKHEALSFYKDITSDVKMNNNDFYTLSLPYFPERFDIICTFDAKKNDENVSKEKIKIGIIGVKPYPEYELTENPSFEIFFLTLVSIVGMILSSVMINLIYCIICYIQKIKSK